MMDMLKSYAHQVVSYLPAKQRDELFDEIYANLSEEFDDWKLANPGLDEVRFLNQCKSHPIRYATRMAAEDSAYLVGPQFYFSFLSALKIAVTVVLVFHLVIGVISALASGQIWAAAWNLLISIPNTLIWVAAAVLGVFVALEKSGEKATWLDKWDASELEPVDSHRPISRGEVLFELVIASFALLWVSGIVKLPGLIRYHGEWVGEWAVKLPDAFWLAVALLLVFDIGFAVYRLTRSLWTARLRALAIISGALWFCLAIYAIEQPSLLAVSHEKASAFLPVAENALKGGLIVLCLILAWDILSHSWRLFRANRN
jgi:hypothetical protein